MGFFDNFNESMSSGNHMSPFGEAGLLFDPIYRLTGEDDGAYAKFMRKTWEKPNEWLSPYAKKFHAWERKNPWINPLQAEIDKTEIGGNIKGWSENKPADSIFAITGAAFGGPALLGGMGGGAAGGGAAGGGAAGGGSTGGGLGLFSNGGVQGMGSVGSGNAGALFANTGINTGGVAGVGGTGASATSGLGTQDYLKMGQGLLGGQQQQPQQQAMAPPSQPQNQKLVLMMQIQRNKRAQELRRKSYRTPEEVEELRALTNGTQPRGLLSNA
jgi:hypothetical protein